MSEKKFGLHIPVRIEIAKVHEGTTFKCRHLKTHFHRIYTDLKKKYF